MYAKSADEDGRELFGVAFGVSLGVDAPLSPPTRDFLDDERGVMLLFRNALTGVMFSWATVGSRGVVPPLLLRAGRVLWTLLAEAAVGATARRGVNGVFAVRLLASVGFSGRAVCWLGRSIGILLRVLRSCAWVVRRVRGQPWPGGEAMAWLLGSRRVDAAC